MSLKDIKRNFGDLVVFDGKTTKFLRIERNAETYGSEGSPAEVEEYGIRVKCTEARGDDSDLKKLLLNDVPIYDMLPSSPKNANSKYDEFNYFILTDEITDIAYKLDYTDPVEKGEVAVRLVFDIYEYKAITAYEESMGVTDPLRRKIDSFSIEIHCIQQENKKSGTEFKYLPFTGKELHDTSSSYTLMRANPLLTGNVKLTVDSKGSLFLNTLDANDDLTSAKYKNFSVSKNSSYAADLKKFLDDGKIEPEVFYYVKKQEYNYTKTDFSEQVDDFYQYGVSQCASKYYDEEFQFFAPLRLTKNIPEFFAIFRVEHPLSKSSYMGGSSFDVLKELIDNAEIIKTFDLREGTGIGDYLRTITNNARFTNDPLRVSYNNETPSAWSGIAYDEGQYSERSEFIRDKFFIDEPIKEFEKFMTEGFKRNKIVVGDIINLEFLFDDNDSKEYSINRYFGLYLNKIDIDRFESSNLLMSINRDQLPRLRVGIDAEKYSLTPFTQYNDNGIEIPTFYKESDEYGDVIAIIDNNDIKDHMFAIIDRDNNLHRLKSMKKGMYDNNGSYESYSSMVLFDKKMDVDRLCGIDKLVFSNKAYFADSMPACMMVEFNDALGKGYCAMPGEKFIISIGDINVDTDKWTLVANATGVKEETCWSFPVYDISDSSYKNMFNPYGTPEECATAFAKCVNSFKSTLFEAVSYENKVIITSKNADESGNDLRLTREFSCEENSGACKFFSNEGTYKEIDGKYIDSYYFAGGTSTKMNVAIIDAKDALSIEKDYYFQTQSKRYSKIKNFGNDDHPIVKLPYIGNPRIVNGELVGYNNVDNYVMIELENREAFLTTQMGYISAYNIFMPTFSMLSICPVKDFDSSFFTSDYAYAPMNELIDRYSSITLLRNEEIELERNEVYVLTKGSGKLVGKTVGSPKEDVILSAEDGPKVFETYFGSEKMTFIALTDEGAHIAKYNVSSVGNIDDLKKDFKGFYGLTTLNADDTDGAIIEMKKKDDVNRFFYNMLVSEYDRLNENQQRKYSTESLVVPTTVKWGMDGTDARGNYYRLNKSKAFGITNYTPSEMTVNDPALFTHEWLYLNEFPEIDASYVPTSRCYMYSDILSKLKDCDESIKDKDLGRVTLERLMLNEDYDFFSMYFNTGDGNSTFEGVKGIRRQERYSNVHYSDSINSHVTMFRGVKILLKEYDKFGEFVGRSKDYDGYKFSGVLVKDYHASESFNISIYDNKKFKTLTLVVKIRSGEFNDLHGMSYLDLYTSSNMVDYSSFSYNSDMSILMMPQYKDTYIDAKVKLNTSIKNNETKFYFDSSEFAEKYGISFDSFIKCPSIFSLGYGDDGGEYALTSNGAPSFYSDYGIQNMYSSGKYEYTSDTNFNIDGNGCGFTFDGLTYGKRPKRNFANVWMLNGGNASSYTDRAISFSKLKTLLEEGKYTYYTNDNSYTMKMVFVPTTKIEKSNVLGTIEDSVKPDFVAPHELCAYVNNDTNNHEVIYRYDGKFRPLYKDVIRFTMNESNDLCSKVKYNLVLCNTSLLDDPDNGTLFGMTLNKVADDELMRKDNAGNIVSDYSILGYVTTFQTDVQVAKSNWDNNFFTKFNDTLHSEKTSGQESIKECKAFLGSKVMNVPNTYRFSTYNEDECNIEVIESNYQNSTLAATNVKGDKGSNKIHISFDMSKRMLREFIEDGAQEEFYWSGNVLLNTKLHSYVRNSEYMEKYVKEYMRRNILDLYEIKGVKVYSFQVAGEDRVLVDLSETEILKRRYKEYENAKADIYNEGLGCDVDITLDDQLHYVFAIVIEIGRI